MVELSSMNPSMLMNQSLFGSENGVIINQIITMITSISYNSREKVKFLMSIVGLLPKIGMILCAKHLVNHTDKISKIMMTAIKSLLYRKDSYSICTNDGLGMYMNNIINKTGSQFWSSYRLLIENDVNVLKIFTLRFMPKCVKYDELLRDAENSKIKEIRISANCVKLVQNGKTISVQSLSPNKMFPSRNYIHLVGMINRSIDVFTKLEYYRVIPILINGEPGLGKSKFLDFLAFNSKIGHIRKVDLTEFTNSEIPLATILSTALPTKITSHTVIIIDELDKYISSVCKVDESPERINDILLNHVLNTIESDSTSSFCIYIIFCSNNFNTMFDYIAPDRKIHYESLKNRFLKVIFHRLDKAEFGKYIHWLTKQISADVDMNQIDQLINQLPNDFSITSRDLNNECIVKHFDIEEICRTIQSSPEHIEPVPPVYLPVEKPKVEVPKVEVPKVKLCTPINPPTVTLASVEEDNQKSAIEEAEAIFGANPFDEEDWSTYLGCADKPIYECEGVTIPDELLMFIVSSPACDEDQLHTVINIIQGTKKYHLIPHIFSKHPGAVNLYTESIAVQIDDIIESGGSVREIIESIPLICIEEFKKRRTDILMILFHLDGVNENIAFLKFTQHFDEPGEIPVLEWLNLPIFKNRMDMKKLATDIPEILKYKYSYKHQFPGELTWRNQAKKIVSLDTKIIVENFFTKLDRMGN